MNAGSNTASAPLTADRSDSSWYSTYDHKRIGMIFLGWTLGALLLGAIFGLWLSMVSAAGKQQDAGFLFQVVTYHRLVLVFLFLVPAIPSVFGFSLLPDRIGADGFAFPAMSRFSLRFYILGLLMVLFSVAIGPVSSGWTLPTPLSLGDPGAFGFLAFGLFFLAASWFTTGVNFLVTIHHRRSPQMGFFQMPPLAWGLYLGAFQLVFSGVIFAIIILYLAGGHLTGKGLFGAGSDPLLWQRYFWFAMRPAAFFALIPAAGLISEVVAAVSRKKLTAPRMVVGSLIASLAIGLTTWGVHLAGLGQDPGMTFTFSLLALLAVVPAALIAYAWLATMYQGANHDPAATFFLIVFYLLAGAAVLMELIVRSPGLGSYLATTLFASVELDYLVWGAVLSALLAGLQLWWPVLTGRPAGSGLALAGGMLYVVGLNLALVPQIVLGARGVPADMMVLARDAGAIPQLSLFGWILTVLGLILVLANLAGALMHGETADSE